MMLVIREYLSMLKESEELDSLLNDLLLSIGLIPLDKPQIGARQYGVDIKAIGKLKDDLKKTIYLFVIKQGDIKRDIWDSGPQAVRQSLNEINDFYLDSMLEEHYKDYPIKIILCTNGEMDQTVQTNWTGYIKKNSSERISYDFWGGNTLSQLINDNLLNEYLFPEEMQKYIRKALAFLDIKDYDYRDIFDLIESIVEKIDITNTKNLNKSMRMLNLIVNMIHSWGCENGNTFPGYVSINRALIRLWEKFECEDIFNKPPQTTKSKLIEFMELLKTQNRIYIDYLNNITPHCNTLHGFSLVSRNHVQYSNVVYEQISRVSTIAYHFMTLSLGKDKIFFKEYTHAVNLLMAIICNNPSSEIPVTDDQIDPISMAIIVLSQSDRKKDASQWLSNIVSALKFNYDFNNVFPLLYTDDEKLIDLHYFEEKYEPKTSLMIFQLFMWMSMLDMKDEYEQFREYVNNNLSELNLQYWYPDSKYTDFYYKSSLSPYESGLSVTNLTIESDIDDFKKLLMKQWKKYNSKLNYSFVEFSFPQLGFIVSDHFRVPLLPKYHEDFYYMINPNQES